MLSVETEPLVLYLYFFYFFMKCFLKRIVLLPLLSSSSSIISQSVLPLSRQNRRPVIFFFFKNGILTSHHVCQATLKRVCYDHQSTPIPPSTITSRCQPELGWAVWPCSPGDMWSCFTGTWRGGVCLFFLLVLSVCAFKVNICPPIFARHRLSLTSVWTLSLNWLVIIAHLENSSHCITLEKICVLEKMGKALPHDNLTQRRLLWSVKISMLQGYHLSRILTDT